MIVPTLCIRSWDAERPGLHSHAERGNDHYPSSGSRHRLDRDVVRSVFVDPAWQGAGIGKQLMATIDSVAQDANIEALRVPSSITAEGFYSRLGYRKVRDEFHGAERTIIMQRCLPRLNSRHANELARDIGQ